CGHGFIVQNLAQDKVDSEGAPAHREAVTAREPAAAPAAPSPSPELAAPPPEPPKPVRSALDEELEADSNPYGVSTLDLSPRCPNCANELESADALICLHCGYNTQTRRWASTKKTIEHTGGENFAWLLPGLIC